MTQPQEVQVIADLTRVPRNVKSGKPSYYFVLADKHFGGGLANYLRVMREQGKTYEYIHNDLWNNHDIPLSLPTVTRWINQYI